MKVLLQKVLEAKVELDGKIIGSIGKGYLLFVGITHTDTEKDMDFLIEKVLNLRIYEADGKYFDKSIVEHGGEILVVSQFTLYASTDKGRRPDFNEAAKPVEAEKLYNLFIQKFRQKCTLKVETGQFQAMMKVHLINDGPCTIMIESKT